MYFPSNATPNGPQAQACQVTYGINQPNGNVTAPFSSLYLQGATGATGMLWYKAGGSGVTGWSAVANIPRAVSAGYTAAAGDDVWVNSATGPVVIGVPLAVLNPSAVIKLKKTSTDYNSVTLLATGADLIDGASTQVFTGPLHGGRLGQQQRRMVDRMTRDQSALTV